MFYQIGIRILTAAQIVLLDVMAEQMGTNGNAGMTCYVCLEPCLARSNCRCQAVVHECCLRDVEQQLATTVCTICKHAIGEPGELELGEPGVELVLEAELEAEPVPYCTGCISVVYIFLLYCIFGWIGKCVLFLVSVPVEYFLAFWTVLHLGCVLAVVALSVVVHLITQIL